MTEIVVTCLQPAYKPENQFADNLAVGLADSASSAEEAGAAID
jgi:hypothetical protein